MWLDFKATLTNLVAIRGYVACRSTQERRLAGDDFRARPQPGTDPNQTLKLGALETGAELVTTWSQLDRGAEASGPDVEKL